MYGTTTVGAFAAHVYGFKRGGVRQMREELERLHTRLVKTAEASSDLTMDALERKYNEQNGMSSVDLSWRSARQ